MTAPVPAVGRPVICEVSEVKEQNTYVILNQNQNAKRFPVSVRESFCFSFQSLKLR